MNSPSRRTWAAQMRLDIAHRLDLMTNPAYQPEQVTYRPKETEYRCDCGAGHRVDQVNWSGINRPIVFAHRKGFENQGNKMFRAFQLVDMLKTLGAPMPITLQPLENVYRSRPKHKMIVILGSAARPKSHPLLRALRRRKNTLLFDVVDGIVPEKNEGLADAFICASLTEKNAREAAGHRAVLYMQSPDQRTPSFPSEEKTFSITYYGLAENARHLEDLPEIENSEFVGMPDHQSTEPVPSVFDTLRRFSHHYSVRAWNDRDGFKPMMKGFFAARLGAVVIASAEDEESRLVLGEDYPYLAKSSSLEDVKAIIDYARDTHLGEEWHRAVGTMRELRHMSCPVKTAQDLVAGLRGL